MWGSLQSFLERGNLMRVVRNSHAIHPPTNVYLKAQPWVRRASLNLLESTVSMINYIQINNESNATFLHLPRELRDLCYSNLLEYRRHTPEDPEHAGDRAFHNKTYYEAQSPRPALLQLKLCSRQVYAEVSDVLVSSARHRLNDSGPPTLDIMVKGSLIWPTWISLPNTRRFHSIVHINLRLFEAKGSEFSTGAYRALWALFNQLVFQGPCLNHNRIGLDPPLRIGRLRFEIRLCFPTSVDDLFGTYRDVFERLERLASDNVGLGHVDTIEACMGPDRRVWRLKQLPTGLTIASRIA